MVRILFHVGWETMESLGREGVCNEKHHPEKKKKKKNTTLAAMWIMDCQGTRGEARRTRYYTIADFSMMMVVALEMVILMCVYV